MDLDTIYYTAGFLSLPDQIHVYWKFPLLHKRFNEDISVWNIDMDILEDMIKNRMDKELCFISERYPIIGASSIRPEDPEYRDDRDDDLSLLDIILINKNMKALGNLLRYSGHISCLDDSSIEMIPKLNRGLFKNIICKVNTDIYSQVISILITTGNTEKLDISFKHGGYEIGGLNPLEGAIERRESLIPYLLDKSGIINNTSWIEGALDEAIRIERKDIAEMIISKTGTKPDITYVNRDVIINSYDRLKIYLELGGILSYKNVCKALKRGDEYKSLLMQYNPLDTIKWIESEDKKSPSSRRKTLSPRQTVLSLEDFDVDL